MQEFIVIVSYSVKTITQIQKSLMCHHYHYYIPAFPLLAQPKLPDGEIIFRWKGEGRNTERESKEGVFKWPCYPIGPPLQQFKQGFR